MEAPSQPANTPRLAIAGLQIDSAWEDPAATFVRIEAQLRAAAATGARVLVLPEMFATGFSMRADAMASHHDAARAFCAGQARSLGVWLIAGMVEPAPHGQRAHGSATTRPQNCAVLFGPDGSERGRYRKIHPFTFGGEHEHYQGGDASPIWEIEGVRVTPLVCYDLRFVELFRLAASETDVFVVIANWPEARWEHWTTLLRARAIECQAYVLGVNRVGEGGGLRYRGDSMLIGPFGEVLASASAVTTTLLGHVDPAEVSAVRGRTSFLVDRRPSVYEAVAAARMRPR